MTTAHPTRRLMNLIRRNGFAGLAALSLTAFATQSDFSDGWHFHLGDAAGAEAPSFVDAGWDQVTLPHPARVEARVTGQGASSQWEGICWYRKTFTLPPDTAGQTVWLRFEGAMNLAQVFVNGQPVAASVDGYTPMVADLTPFVRTTAGPITVAVRLDNHNSPTTGPKPHNTLDFNLYHGLYRTVSLNISPPLHITDEILENQVASGGVFVTFPAVSATAATVDAKVHVRNSSAQSATFALSVRLTDLAGKEIVHQDTPGLQLAAGDNRQLDTTLAVANPRLWSPSAPNLYWLETSLVAADGQITDKRRTRIGIRRIALEPGGIIINGQKLFLNGTDRHQEYPYVGNAVPANAQWRDAARIKEDGFDFVRLSHYPQSPDFMDACDELGIVTEDSILGWQYANNSPEFTANRIEAAHELIRRDRNHASAVIWEVQLNETRMSAALTSGLTAAAKAEYPGDQMFTAGVPGPRAGYDISLQSRQGNSTRQFQNITTPGIVDEYGDWEYYANNNGFNQEQWANLLKEDRNSRQARSDGEVRLLQQALNFEDAHNENLGTKAMGDCTWVMFDYSRGYAPDLEKSGMMDNFRLPKFVYYFFQSQRDATFVMPGGLPGGPMVFAATWWTPKSPLDIRVFSNTEEVELLLNGRSLGRQKPVPDKFSSHLPHPPLNFKVAAFEPGELKAVGYIGGQAVAQQIIRTPGAAQKLGLALDLSGRPLAVGDLVFAYAQVQDANGTDVPDSAAPVKFAVEGDAQIIGDNPSPAEAGIATVLVKVGPKGGAITLRATADSLAPASLTGTAANPK